MHLYPSLGLLVRDPVKRDYLPVEGREVPDGDFYWLRRLGCGDATLTKPEPAAEQPPTAPPALAESEQPLPSDGSDEQ